MGYYTRYCGQFDITPPLTKAEYLRLAQAVAFWNSEKIVEKATSDVFDSGLPALTPADKIIKDTASQSHYGLTFCLKPDAIEANEEDVKGYDDEDNLALAVRWLHDNGHQMDGAVSWNGSENQDTGTIYAAVVDRKPRIEFVKDKHENPGPSWKQSSTSTPQ